MRKVNKPCPVNWDSMQKTSDCSIRFCSQCQKKVFDITQLDKAEREALYQQEHGSICVRVRQKSSFNQFDSYLKLRKTSLQALGKVALLTGSIFLSTVVYAQKNIKPSYTINQQKTVSTTLIIRGKVRGNKHKEVFIKVYDQKTQALIGQTQVDHQGLFSISVDRREFRGNYQVVVVSKKSEVLTISNLEVRNSTIEIELNTPRKKHKLKLDRKTRKAIRKGKMVTGMYF